MNSIDNNRINNMLRIRNLWPEWMIGEELGRGQYATVYSAIKTVNLTTTYGAIKVISIPADDNENKVSAEEIKSQYDDAMAEIKKLVSLKGKENIVSIETFEVVERNDLKTPGWYIYILMELLTPLPKYAQHKVLTESDIIRLGIDMCNALAACEKERILHRDIKPDNIFIDENIGVYKLGDFGVSRKLKEFDKGITLRVGTEAYMAPEVDRYAPYDSRSDLYSLGIVLYQYMNKNRLPFSDYSAANETRKNIDLIVSRRSSGEEIPSPSDASVAFAKIILKMCAYEPEDRFQSADEVRTALLKVIDSKQDSNEINEHFNADSELYNGETLKVRHAPKMDETLNADHPAEKRQNNKSSNSDSVSVDMSPEKEGFFSELKKDLRDEPDDKKNQMESRKKNEELRSRKNKKPVDKKKIRIILSGFSVALLIALAGTVFYYRNQSIEKEIDDIISTSEDYAAAENYEEALKVVREELDKYSDSQKLKDKEEEYKEALEQQKKSNILSEALAKSNNGDYAGAIDIIRNVENYGADNDYLAAYESYAENYKDSVIKQADSLSDVGQYLEAIEVIRSSSEVLDDNSSLTYKIEEYEEHYITDIVSLADAEIEEGNLEEAEQIISEALLEFPGNSRLKETKARIDDLKPLTAAEIIKLLDDSVISQSGTYMAYTKPDTISVFGQEVTNAFSVNTNASYNIWGYGTQSVDFRIDGFKGNYLSFSICGETGTSGSVTIDVFMDRTADDNPDYTFELPDAPYPISVGLDITDRKSMSIRVSNHAGHGNRIVFYDFAEQNK